MALEVGFRLTRIMITLPTNIKSDYFTTTLKPVQHSPQSACLNPTEHVWKHFSCQNRITIIEAMNTHSFAASLIRTIWFYQDDQFELEKFVNPILLKNY